MAIVESELNAGYGAVPHPREGQKKKGSEKVYLVENERRYAHSRNAMTYFQYIR